jgi:phosphate ABC transporter phosphate-binding protein
MPAPATADSFLRLLDTSKLLPADLIDPYRGTAQTPRQLADRLTADRLLTPFQAKQLLAGRHRGFFLTSKYKVLDQVGEGGMGRVLLCEHLILNKLVAVKLLTGADDIPGARERFLREARALARLDHPHITRVFDVDATPTGPFLVMEYVDGTNLHQLVAQGGPVAPGRAAGFARMAALGLAHAHQNGLVHRDIKPGNLMLDRTGTVKLLDLGLARFFDAKRNRNLTRRFDAKNILGTADFIAPEQAVNSSDVDIRADIYSLGCTLYYLLAGRFPFPDGQPLEKLVWHQTRAFDPVRQFAPAVPAGLAAVLDRMVAKGPADRYQTPEAVAEALADFAPPPAPPPAFEMPRTRAGGYALGLCEAPDSGALAQPSPTSPVRLQPDSHATFPTPTTDPGSVPTLRTPTSSPRLVLPPPEPARRSLAPWAVAGLAAVFALAVGLWEAVRRPPAGPVAGPGPLPLAGSTFIRPLMDRWTAEYERQTGAAVSYDPVGSPRGVARMRERVAAAGLTDLPLTDPEVKSAEVAEGPVLHVPLALGAVAVTYSLPDAGPEPLTVNAAVLADLYRGTLTRWDDVALKALNPGRSLPPTRAVPVRRADGSGTTALFTTFLGREVATWTAVGMEPGWPAAAREGKGNDGVAAEVGRTPGAVGYVEMTFALRNRLAVARVANPAGEPVAPTVASVRAAAADLAPPPDLRFDLLGRAAPGAYPLTGATWAVLFKAVPGGRGPEAAAFLRWCLTDGQQMCAELHYAPLPPALAAAAVAKLADVK